METALQNMTRDPKGFRYSDDMYKFGWFLKYIGGKRLINHLRGIGNCFNIPLPSNKQLKERKPKVLHSNDLDNITIPPKKYFIAFDEMDIRNGK